MDAAKDGKRAPSNADGAPESAAPQTISMDAAMELLSRSSFAGAEKFSLAMERFSVLSTEMITLLMGLSQEINKSVEELNAVRSAVDIKKKELETLLEAEQSARALQQQTEALQRQKEELEKVIGDQRRSWEEETAQRESERRERQEAWNAEQLKARQELEEEIQAIRQRTREAQEAADRELAAREEILKSKELEWNALIQELERFLSGLAGQSAPPSFAPAFLQEDSATSSDSPLSGIPLSGCFGEETGWLPEDTEAASNFDEAVMWERVCGEDSPAFGDRGYGFRPNINEDPGISRAFIKDVHALQNRRMEESDMSPKRDNAPLKFALKNTNNHA